MRVGLVGCGRWGINILRDLVSLGCEVDVVVRSLDHGAAAMQGGAAHVWHTVGDLPNVDGVVIAAPTAARPEILEALSARDVPLFTEKPLAASVRDAEALTSLCGGRLFVMEKWRYHPGVRALAAIARDGTFGSVVGMRTTRRGWGIDHPDVDAVWTLLPHDIAIVDEVLGGLPEPAWAVGEMLKGEPVALTARLGESPWAVVDVSAVSRHFQREVRLSCRDATVVLGDAHADHLEVVTDAPTGAEPVSRRIAIDGEMPLLAELREFVEHVGGGPPPRVNAARGLEGVRVIARLRTLAGADG